MKYFSNLQVLKESESISDCDMKVYINHLDKLTEDVRIRFGDLDDMHVSEWLVASFDMKIDNKGYESDLEDELIEMCVDLKVEALFKSTNLSKYWSNIYAVAKYHKLRAADKPFLFTFPTSYMAKAGFCHVDALFTKQKQN